MSKDKLKAYKEKRNFSSTSEPTGGEDQQDSNIFVIQKHDATNLHYDFRIAYDGVLKSWAIPKGPSLNPSDKRLAIPTEDHPLEYADFEGVIPKDNYGAGTVMLWDTGTYDNIREEDGQIFDMAEAFADGHLTLELNGEKLQGAFALIRTGQNDSARWLLVKVSDEEADRNYDILKEEPNSVKTGRSLEEIAEGSG